MESYPYYEQTMNIIKSCESDIVYLLETYGPIQFPYYIDKDYFTIEQFIDLYGDFDIRYGNPFHNMTMQIEEYCSNIVERDIVEIKLDNGNPTLVTLENTYPIRDLANIMDIIRIYELIVEHLNNR